jgi:hypothetical protein
MGNKRSPAAPWRHQSAAETVGTGGGGDAERGETRSEHMASNQRRRWPKTMKNILP